MSATPSESNPSLPVGEGGAIDVPVVSGVNGQIDSRFSSWWTLRFQGASANWSLDFACSSGTSYVFINDTLGFATLRARTTSSNPLVLSPGQEVLVVAIKDSSTGIEEFVQVSTQNGGSGIVVVVPWSPATQDYAPIVQAIIAGLPSTGGVIDFTHPGNYLFGTLASATTIDNVGKPITLRIYPGVNLQWGANDLYPAKKAGLCANGQNLLVLGFDRESCSLSCGNGTRIIDFKGQWPSAEILTGRPSVRFEHVAFVGPGNGHEAQVVDTTDLPAGAFQEGFFILRDFTVNGFGSATKTACVIGVSSFYQLFDEGYFRNNGSSVYLGNNSNTDLQRCTFYSTGRTSVVAIGPDNRVVDCHFFGSSGYNPYGAAAVEADLQILPEIDGARGYAFACRNTFHPEYETWNPNRTRLLCQNITTPIDCVQSVLVQGNRFFGNPGVYIDTISRTANVVTMRLKTPMYVFPGTTFEIGVIAVRTGTAPGGAFNGRYSATATSDPEVFTYPDVGPDGTGDTTGGIAYVLSQNPISLKSPVGDLIVDANHFFDYATLVDDSQPNDANLFYTGNCVFTEANTARMSSVFGIRVCKNGGRGFSVIRPSFPVVQEPWGPTLRRTQSFNGGNRLIDSERFGAGSAWTATGLVPTDGQPDPWGGNNAANIACNGTTGNVLSAVVDMTGFTGNTLYCEILLYQFTAPFDIVEMSLVDTVSNTVVERRTVCMGSTWSPQCLIAANVNPNHSHELRLYPGDRTGTNTGTFRITGAFVRDDPGDYIPTKGVALPSLSLGSHARQAASFSAQYAHDPITPPSGAVTSTGLDTGSAAYDAGSTNRNIVLTLSPTGTPLSSGTVDVVYGRAYSGTLAAVPDGAPAFIDGSGTWNGRVLGRFSNVTNAGFRINWDNNGVALAAGSTYRISVSVTGHL